MGQEGRRGRRARRRVPELVLNGYPVEDLTFRASFIAATRQALDQLAADLEAAGLGELVCVVGYIDSVQDSADRLGVPKGSRRTPPR